MAGDRERIVQVPSREMDRLRQWLQQPNGALIIGTRVTFEAVEGGGILIRTKPYRYVRRDT